MQYSVCDANKGGCSKKLSARTKKEMKEEGKSGLLGHLLFQVTAMDPPPPNCPGFLCSKFDELSIDTLY